MLNEYAERRALFVRGGFMSKTNLDDLMDLSDWQQVEWYDDMIGNVRIEHPYLGESQEVISMLEQAEKEL